MSDDVKIITTPEIKKEVVKLIIEEKDLTEEEAAEYFEILKGPDKGPYITKASEKLLSNCSPVPKGWMDLLEIRKVENIKC